MADLRELKEILEKEDDPKKREKINLCVDLFSENCFTQYTQIYDSGDSPKYFGEAGSLALGRVIEDLRHKGLIPKQVVSGLDDVGGEFGSNARSMLKSLGKRPRSAAIKPPKPRFSRVMYLRRKHGAGVKIAEYYSSDEEEGRVESESSAKIVDEGKDYKFATSESDVVNLTSDGDH